MTEPLPYAAAADDSLLRVSSRTRETARVFWMLYWRQVVAAPFIPGQWNLGSAVVTGFWVCILAAIALVASQHTLAERPITGLIRHRRHPVMRYRRRSRREIADTQARLRYHGVNPSAPLTRTTRRPSHGPRAHVTTEVAPSRPVIDRPTAKGTMTGFEPYVLDAHTLRRPPSMYGEPGAGLSDSGFDVGAIAAGQAGEINFAKALDISDLLGSFDSFWSVGMPDDHGYRDREFSSDIDCVLVTGSTIWLVDLKNYSQGDVAYTSYADGLYCLDGPTQSWVGKPRKQSANMSMAVDRFKAAFGDSGLHIESRVVLMPTNSGMGSVYKAAWPGGITAVTLPAFLGTLSMQPPVQHHSVGPRLRGLLK